MIHSFKQEDTLSCWQHPHPALNGHPLPRCGKGLRVRVQIFISEVFHNRVNAPRYEKAFGPSRVIFSGTDYCRFDPSPRRPCDWPGTMST